MLRSFSQTLSSFSLCLSSGPMSGLLWREGGLSFSKADLATPMDENSLFQKQKRATSLQRSHISWNLVAACLHQKPSISERQIVLTKLHILWICLIFPNTHICSISASTAIHRFVKCLVCSTTNQRALGTEK